MPLTVEKIANGTVIDHINAGMGLDVLKVLNIDRSYGARVALVMNVSSKKIGKKDIVKIEGKFIDEKTANRIALIAPNATLNIIRNSEVVEKKKVKVPDEIVGILKCPNPNCITNFEKTDTRFRKRQDDILVCIFCEKTFSIREFV
ncbi:MAG: aspartate carbamoyltransferase regulatory subunit [Candidatus Micrarchaeia archaeon]